MADKIVQLVDANDDNIFPLSSDPSAAHITMTTTDPGEGAALAANNFIGVYGGDPIIMDYSTTEVNTGAKWIDGRAIYKKTFSIGPLPNNALKEVSHNISGLSRVIRAEGFAYDPTIQRSYPLLYPSYQAAGNSIAIYINNTKIFIGTGIDRSGLTESYVTLYYTKSS